MAEKSESAKSGATAGYSGTPLVKKLGIKADTVLAILNAPQDFAETLGTLPEGVSVRTTARGQRDLTIWFPKNAKDLKQRIPALAESLGMGSLWIAWPKKASGVVTDLSDAVVRSTALQHNIVDYKVCAIDQTYSGLKFAQRKS